MLKATITVEGVTDSDLRYALEEVQRLMGEGFTSGHNRNDTGRFSFHIEGEEVPPEKAG